jgi:drug/metabolite transporter (DMT)-like permease
MATGGMTMKTEEKTERPINQGRIGLILALTGFLVLSSGDGLVKSTAGDWPGTAVAALRYFFGAGALGVIVAVTRGRAGFAVPRMDIQFARGASVAVATLTFFLGAQLMPLADVTSIQFTNPLFVALLSPWLLGERTPRIVWISTAIAMTGVAIVLRPNVAMLGPAAFLPVLAAAGMAFLVIFNRKVSDVRNILALQFWIAVLAFPLLLAAAIIGHVSGYPPLQVNMPDWVTVLKCAGAAFTGTVAHWLIYLATVRASAPVIAPMVYVQLLMAGIIGWTVFGDRIDAPSAAGMILIILSGLLLWRSQRRSN